MQKPMRFVWQSLLWKEWHEQKWKLLGFTFVSLLFFLWFLRDDPYSLPIGVYSFVLYHASLATIFVGMQTAGGENGRGTMAFLQTLPISMHKPAMSKLLMAWLTVVLPMLVFFGCVYAALYWHRLTATQVLQEINWRDVGFLSIWGIKGRSVVTLLGQHRVGDQLATVDCGNRR